MALPQGTFGGGAQGGTLKITSTTFSGNVAGSKDGSGTKNRT